MVKCVFDSGGSLRPVGNRDHHRRDRRAGVLPRMEQHLPVLPQQIVSLHQQVRQRFLRRSGPVDVVLHCVVRINMIQLGAQALSIGDTIIPHHHPGRFDQAGFNAVI